jgi:BirA family transcriptional regulator, biotin operon repressor / biotin---[acetyl-CoA-carboxylase] ligase
MEFQLAPTAVGEGYRLETFDTVGSTNAVALERAVGGDPGKLWLVAKRQESGRGRRGRAWETLSGNLAATLLISNITDLSPSATLGFVAGLSLGDALEAVAPDADISIGIDGSGSGGRRYELKWPNDVLARGAKMAGILLESVKLPTAGYGLAIGIGVNVVSHPADVPYPATSLSELGADCTAADLFLALSDAWVDNMRGWSGGHGLSNIRERWLSRAAGLGSDIVVRLHGEVLRGTFETIDEECRLVLRDGNGNMRRIAAGDVHFGAMASSEAV